MKRTHMLHPSRRLRLLRYVSQGIVVLVIAYLGLRHQATGGGPRGSAPIDSYCVFGGLETFWTFITTGTFLAKTNLSNIVLLVSVVLLTLLTGASFCSWICPLGTIQDVLAGFGKKIFGRTFLPSPRLDKYLRHLRFASLLLILYFTIRLGSLWFADYDPFKAIFHFSFETLLPIFLIAGFVVLSILSERFWCKYLCPLGAFFSLFSRLSLFKLKRNPDSCKSCNLCNRSCPMGLNVAQANVLSDGQCIKCLNCIQSCPLDGALSLETKRR
ncbi:4Fe-4S binding protein [Alicyclobacillus sp. SO9]|uniref:4Fe-4S binding protein n=1 Tax=Alicyclobacillus sp. SO9 TaxID=2665646 RepID=UPI0018E8B8BB|nr:4Fe-4S binding protein [Alicyclobacillus sp. SO9]QQE80272.1 4Fe-4S binding protein [Alicyclobacillus sp. SO9]